MAFSSFRGKLSSLRSPLPASLWGKVMSERDKADLEKKRSQTCYIRYFGKIVNLFERVDTESQRKRIHVLESRA